MIQRMLGPAGLRPEPQPDTCKLSLPHLHTGTHRASGTVLVRRPMMGECSLSFTTELIAYRLAA